MPTGRDWLAMAVDWGWVVIFPLGVVTGWRWVDVMAGWNSWELFMCVGNSQHHPPTPKPAFPIHNPAARGLEPPLQGARALAGAQVRVIIQHLAAGVRLLVLRIRVPRR